MKAVCTEMESDIEIHDLSAPTSTTDNLKMDAVHWPGELQQPHPNPEFDPNPKSQFVEEVAVRLCQSVAKGEWREVRKICHENWLMHNLESLYAPITGLGGTVLHVAAYNNLEDIFKLLLQQLGPPGSLFTDFCLRKQNIKGNTPLHYAALVGSENMCRSIIDIAESTTLLSVCNAEGETPLFIAAFHGHKDAFLYLHSICSHEEAYNYCTRTNGDTILHCTISDERYELSLIIVRLYKDLVNRPNRKGMTPLHLLASKPSTFKSGSDLQWFENIIYHSFVITDEQELIRSAEQNLEKNQVTHGRQQMFGSRRGATIAASEVDAEDPERYRLTWGGYHSRNGARRHQFHFPSNYETCCLFGKVLFKAMLLILEPLKKVKKVRMMKLRHTWSNLIMTELLKNFSMYQSPTQSSSLSKSENKKSERGTLAADVSEKINTRQLSKICEDKYPKDCQTYINIIQLLCKMAQDEKDKEKGDSEPEEVLLMAAKNGITEMVKKILESYPMALYNMDKNQKNIVLLTVEHKQPQVYELLLSLKEKNIIKDSLFCEVDFEGNSVLHLAATKAEFNWPVPGAASQMQWEIRWYEYIENSMEGIFLPLLNKKGQTPEEVFTKTHEDIVKQGGDWLISTSNACSVVAGLFVTSTFATATNVPEVVEGNKHNEASKIFASSSFVSFYTSLVAVVMFLSILTSGCRERDFRRALPWKLLLGLTAFYMSIASTLVSFTTGHFFIFRNQLKFVSSTSYIVTYALVTLFSMAVFPLYFHLVWATLKKVPQRKYRVSIPHWLSED